MIRMLYAPGLHHERRTDNVNPLAAALDGMGDRNSVSYGLRDDPIRMTNALGFSTTNVFDELRWPVLILS
jgi:hypothetical protein